MSEKTYKLTEGKLDELLTKANKEGAVQVLVELGLKKIQISQSDAIRRFGEARILRWREEGKIKPIKSGHIIFYRLHDLERLNFTNDFI